jgi:hypothetical protein
VRLYGLAVAGCRDPACRGSSKPADRRLLWVSLDQSRQPDRLSGLGILLPRGTSASRIPLPPESVNQPQVARD